MAMIHVNRGATSLGILSEQEVREGLRTGRFAPTDIGWREGMANWQPLSQFAEFSGLEAGAAAAPPLQTGTTYPIAAPATVRRTEPLAIWSLVLSVLSLFCCGFVLGVPGVICGHLALSNISKNPNLEGRGMALAGVVIGYVGIALWILWLLLGGVGFLQRLSEGH